MYEIIYKIGLVGWLISAITFVVSMCSPFIYYAFNLNIFELISPIAMLRVGLISFGIAIASIIIQFIFNMFLD